MQANTMGMERSLRHVEVVALELQPPLVLDRSSPVSAVIQAMREQDLGYALLTKDGRLAGIFTERDVFLAVLGNTDTLSRPVAEYMTPEPACVGETAPVWRAVTLMYEGGYRQIPIVDEGRRVLGCVRHKDIAEYLVNHFADHVLNLPPDPEQRARTPEGG